jgi:hypothetical protein
MSDASAFVEKEHSQPALSLLANASFARLDSDGAGARDQEAAAAAKKARSRLSSACGRGAQLRRSGRMG